MQPPSAQAHAALQISRFLPRLSDFLLWRGGCPSSFPSVWGMFFFLVFSSGSSPLLSRRQAPWSLLFRAPFDFFSTKFSSLSPPSENSLLLRSSLLLSFLLSTSIPPFFSSAFLSRVLFSLFSSSSLFLSYQN
ncbi:hypothetical protein TGME49_286810 [Toxoplasma gondii ME49]|uniref:Uncharacterized protein n=1 Tax=Toxoplasma gondii (strain ATCC 50611 / Me49) TaxID=508771 RepID=S8GGM5_TOXGM|nr:hypothetical protein TGME49_286810 [Toxoplasma gondii ME49]EPT30985.1 hypothetical protein TGME49_286810 [Toxoplasma gondii ME49]|eukprot:XP_018637768.1 hypothetical protein TGME49_286810 [Toxoplasma gondii ME49]